MLGLTDLGRRRLETRDGLNELRARKSALIACFGARCLIMARSLGDAKFINRLITWDGSPAPSQDSPIDVSGPPTFFVGLLASLLLVRRYENT